MAERIGLVDFAGVPIPQFYFLQIVKHRGGAIPVDLTMQRLEILVVIHVSFAHLKRRISSLEPTRWNNPTRLTQHQHMNVIPCLIYIEIFSLNRKRWLRN